MKSVLPLVIAGFLTSPAWAQESVAADLSAMVLTGESADLSQYLWINRPVVVFADSPADPRFAEQMDLLNAGLEELADRDVVILTDTDPEAKSELRTELRPRGFMLVLIGKDGGVKLRKPLPWSVRELTRVIDKMPMREREVRERRGDG